MSDLVLPLKREYFEQIKAGEKWFEYRLRNEYWCKRLEGHDAYDRVILTLGYPKAEDESRRIVRPWRGFTSKTITHPHFGSEPVQVYAIDVRPS